MKAPGGALHYAVLEETGYCASLAMHLSCIGPERDRNGTMKNMQALV